MNRHNGFNSSCSLVWTPSGGVVRQSVCLSVCMSVCLSLRPGGSGDAQLVSGSGGGGGVIERTGVGGFQWRRMGGGRRNGASKRDPAREMGVK